ncbi:MAG: hypothetical protein K5673_06440 [Lachnospiraceae bacterium]|nr:hypothetical protein [Lachnospiraceae bacterium]
MIVYQILMCLIILTVIPLCMGYTVTGGLKSVSPVTALCYGYLVMMVSFELVTVPVLLFTDYGNFRYVLWIYTPVMLVIAAAGVFRAHKSGQLGESAERMRDDIGRILHDREQLVVWAVAGVILIAILVLVSVRVIFDGDDAYYVVQSLIAQQKGAMYSSNPYTGRAAAIDMRHALAVFTMWISYVGTVTHIHTTILCHTVLPLVFIPLCLMIYGQLGAALLGDKKELTGYFVIFTELFILFGRVSMYTPEAFLLARTWQGKAVAANILLPMVLLTYAYISQDIISGDERGLKTWLPMIVINASAGVFSSLAVVLVCVMTGAGGLVLSVMKRKIRPLIYACLTCIPGLIYMILYLYYTYFGWR